MTHIKVSKGAFLALFFIISFNLKANIFTDGTIDIKEPSVETQILGRCATGSIHPNFPSLNDMPLEACVSRFKSAYREMADVFYDISVSLIDNVSTTGYNNLTFERKHKSRGDDDDDDRVGTIYSSVFHNNFWDSKHTSELIECDGVAFPEYTYIVDIDDDGITDGCANPADVQNALDGRIKCPIGNHPYQVNGQCVPIQCEPNGTSKAVFVPNNLYNESSSSGTYCNGQCAYNIEGGQSGGNISGGSTGRNVTATGKICGQALSKDAFFNEGNGDTCETSALSDGRQIIQCIDGNVTDENAPDLPDPVDNTEFEADEIGELVPVSENCAAADIACEVRNLKQQNDTDTKEQKEQTKALHDKNLAADAKAFNELIKTINALQTTNITALDQINTSIKDGNGGDGSSSGGTGGSGSGGTGNIPTDGAGLSNEEVGEAVGGLDDTISHDVIDIQDYTSQYSGWLPAASCPADKPFSFSAMGNQFEFSISWAPICDLFSLIGYLITASAWIAVGYMIQRSI